MFSRRAKFSVGVHLPPIVPGAMAYLTRSGTTIRNNGQQWRGAGLDWHWAALRETNLQYPTHAMIDQVLNEAVSMGATVIRAHTLGISAGLSNQLVTSINADGSLVWNNAAWEPIDYVVAGCRGRGLRLWIPFTDQFNYYHKGKQWWVQQAFIRQSTSNIPSSYTYGGTTENGVTSFDPASGTVASSQRYKVISQQFYRNTWIKNAWINNYVKPWFQHVNQYTGVANKLEPAIAFAQGGNELWDSGDQYADHAGADGIAWAAQFSAAVKSVAPGVLVIDPLGADGVNNAYAPGRNDVNTDMLDYHLYNNHNAIAPNYVTNLAATVNGLNKVAVYGEYPFTRSGINYALSEMENTSGVAFGCFWAIYTTDENHSGDGIDDTVYVVGQNAGWKSQFQTHAATMNQGTPPPPPPPPTNSMRSAAVATCDTTASSYSAGSNTVAPTLSIDTTTYADGPKSLKVTNGTAGYPYVYVASPASGAPVTPGSTYTACVSVKAGDSSLTQGTAHITWFDASGNYISGSDGTGVVTVNTTTFQQAFATAVAPSGAASAVPQFQTPLQLAAGATFYLDDWGIFAGTSASPWSSP